ncbi:DUF7289 family protein [Methanoplanus endosymbiosus]|uniref:Uncharacterized protein n=1 Tax=Methanoplanus endosymbiosus TaxID=33865 RepID=A0A9E7PRA2_9EURY|nr:hypothetical protein [Methanoplanus endosymbiosus]UUX93596.1 hypothetical protein L6E24_05620 [Methanoplanus endosymbiosus]
MVLSIGGLCVLIQNSIAKRDDSAVSESIGFIIMFSIVITGIAMVTFYGYPLLIKTQVGSDEKSMEQTMITIQNDMKILTFSNVPYRDLSVMVSGGTLETINSSESVQYFDIGYTLSDGSPQSKTFYPGELRYSSSEGEAVMSIENGAFVRRQKFTEGSVMAANPRWFMDDDTGTLVINLISVESTVKQYLSGIGDLQMSMLSPPETTINDCDQTADVTIKYVPDPDDDYSAAWDNFFSGDSVKSGGLTPLGTPGEFTLQNVNKIVIKEYKIKIENM